jgi:hypothetical protein
MSEPVSFNNNTTTKKTRPIRNRSVHSLAKSRYTPHTHIRIKGLKLTLTWNELSCPVGTRYAKKKTLLSHSKVGCLLCARFGSDDKLIAREQRKREKQIRPDEK